jgi:tetratricopeptide (TPR) repeat protein
MALALWLAHRAAAGERRAALALFLVAGLAAFGLHASFRLLLVAPLGLLALWRLRRGDRWPLLAPVAFAVGGAIVCYLPLRAARDPAANRGDPRTLGRVVEHLAASRIRRAFSGEIMSRDLAVVGRHLGEFLGLLERQLGIPALLAAAGGLGWLLAHRRHRPIGLLTLGVVAGEILYAAWINPMGIADLQCGVPAQLALSVAAGVGVGVAARRLGRERRVARLALAGSLGALLVAPAALGSVEARFRLAQEAPAWVNAALRDLPPRALALVRSDDVAAGALYAQTAWGLRPDVSVLVRQELWDAHHVAQVAARSGGGLLDERELARWRELPESTRVQREGELLRHVLARHLGRRAVLWEPGDDAPPVGRLVPSLPLMPLEPGAPPPPPPSRALVARLDALLAGSRDPLAIRLEVTTLGQLAAAYLVAGDDRQASVLYEVALALRPGDAVAATGLAVVHARRGDFLGAARLVEDVLTRDPSRQVARLNAGRYRLALGETDTAAAHFTQAQRTAPGTAAPTLGLARVALARRQPNEARRLLATVLAAHPDDAEALALQAELR